MIYLIRHGQTAQNHAQLLQGRSDFPLNDTGLAQAAELGRWFGEQGIRFDAVYSSPLCRAVETARQIVGPAFPIALDERLIEMDYGPYEGADLASPAPELLAFFRDFVHTPAPAGMEPLSAVTARCGRFLDAIALKGALEYLTPDARGAYWSRYIGNCAVFCTDVVDGRYRVPTELRR